MELTREEAIKKHYKIKCHIEESKKILNLINEIYDSFENRSCENCKFGMEYHFDDEIECFKIEAETEGNYFSKDFYCNKWEQK